MRNIQPLTIWKDGQNLEVSVLKMIITYDNLDTYAVFQYDLCNVEVKSLTSGNISINGDNYNNWSNGGNSNDEAYQYVASALNLILL